MTENHIARSDENDAAGTCRFDPQLTPRFQTARLSASTGIVAWFFALIFVRPRTRLAFTFTDFI